MKKETLQILVAFAILARAATDKLRAEYYGRSHPGETQHFKEALDRLRQEGLPESLLALDEGYGKSITGITDALFEQLIVAHTMMRGMYEGMSGIYLHSLLLRRSCEHAEAVLATVLDLAQQAAMPGTHPGHVRA